MTDDLEYEGIFPDDDAPIPTADDKPRPGELYKKWFRTPSQAGFLSISPWRETGMVAIDIGEVKDGQLSRATKCYVSAIELTAYLRGACDTNFMHYGGAQVEGKPVSRVFKVEPTDNNRFLGNCGHFEARRSDTGAYIPNMKNSLSQNMIQVTPDEMRQICLRLELALFGWAAADPEWITKINEKRS